MVILLICLYWQLCEFCGVSGLVVVVGLWFWLLVCGVLFWWLVWFLIYVGVVGCIACFASLSVELF